VDVLRQEASLIAAMAEVLSLEGMDDAIEEDYTQYAFEMRDGAIEIVEAVKLQNYDKAVAGMGAITKACSNCHDEWQ
jgi:cytochrome c556